jgi:hypothetical protein
VGKRREDNRDWFRSSQVSGSRVCSKTSDVSGSQPIGGSQNIDGAVELTVFVLLTCSERERFPIRQELGGCCAIGRQRRCQDSQEDQVDLHQDMEGVVKDNTIVQ